jgi:hypothetical protein
MKLNAGSTIIPTPDLEMAKTISTSSVMSRFSLSSFLFNVLAYYKDVSNEPLLRTYVDWYKTNYVSKYFPDAYRDIRGVELRFERNYGRFCNISRQCMIICLQWGWPGWLDSIYENMVKYREQQV